MRFSIEWWRYWAGLRDKKNVALLRTLTPAGSIEVETDDFDGRLEREMPIPLSGSPAIPWMKKRPIRRQASVG